MIARALFSHPAMSQVRPGFLIAVTVFAVFAAYAFLAPATYRTSALLVVDSASPAGSVNMPEPLEAARRLSEGILDRVMLEQLSRERAGSAAPEAQARASSGVRESLAIDTSDAHAFSISYKDADRERAQRVCNQLTHHALERAPIVLADRARESAADLKRQQQTEELAAFLALHPQVAAESAPIPGTSPDKDPALSAFHAEKANLERRVLELESGGGSDNPYLDPAETDLKLLRRRLTEIDTALSARRDALAAKPSAQQLSPELRAEWQRLLGAVTQSSAEPALPSRPALVARVAAEAPLPGSPIDPNRPLLLFFGVVFGGGLGAAYVLVARTAQQRRSKSSRPPKPPSQGALTVQLPAAPAVPSGLGPPVPTPPLPYGPNAAPPIVPVRQRPISSSPPGPQPAPANAGFGSTLPIAKPQPPVMQAEVVRRPASDPPAANQPRRFASTLVLPPSENPSRVDDTPDPVLASAARAWDDQIRAHEVPGFAVVRPRSEPPSSRTSSSLPPPIVEKRASSSNPPPVRPVSSNPPPAATIQRTTSRPMNQMKVTQPLGSFLPDGVWNDPSAGLVRSRTPQNAAPTAAPPSAAPTQQGSTYSYVSKHPPAPSAAPPAPAPAAATAVASAAVPAADNSVAIVRPAPRDWRPESSLDPRSRREVCEQLYPLAVQNCLVLLVVGVPEAQEQKSRVAAEIALALSDSGHPRILLLEADLQSPRVHRFMKVDMPMGSGFSQQLRGKINGNTERRWTVIGCSKSLHVLAEGMMRTPGLLLSQQFADCVRDLRGYYDFIVIDGPSSSLSVESQALDAVTDGVLFVCGKTSSPALSATQALFGEKKLRTVVTT
jgi:Mrp family chromosome partitioning ATPase